MSQTDTFMGDPDGIDTIYRVKIHPTTDTAEVTCLGMDCLDDEQMLAYYKVDELPEWLAGRVATLCLCDFVPPTTAIEGVGRRIDEHTFWVVK